eukprot:15465015-Alexandrium_andersonii.AAC.1
MRCAFLEDGRDRGGLAACMLPCDLADIPGLQESMDMLVQGFGCLVAAAFVAFAAPFVRARSHPAQPKPNG